MSEYKIQFTCKKGLTSNEIIDQARIRIDQVKELLEQYGYIVNLASQTLMTQNIYYTQITAKKEENQILIPFKFATEGILSPLNSDLARLENKLQ